MAFNWNCYLNSESTFTDILKISDILQANKCFTLYFDDDSEKVSWNLFYVTESPSCSVEPLCVSALPQSCTVGTPLTLTCQVRYWASKMWQPVINWVGPDGTFGSGSPTPCPRDNSGPSCSDIKLKLNATASLDGYHVSADIYFTDNSADSTKVFFKTFDYPSFSIYRTFN